MDEIKYFVLFMYCMTSLGTVHKYFGRGGWKISILVCQNFFDPPFYYTRNFFDPPFQLTLNFFDPPFQRTLNFFDPPRQSF